MLRALVCLALLACGSKEPAPSSPVSPTTTATAQTSTPVASTEPLPPVTKVGDRCNESNDCKPLGKAHRCMRTGTTAGCYEVPMQKCDAPACECFNNDPCAANDLGTCSGYEKSVVICSK
jgi:hypothetical protein